MSLVTSEKNRNMNSLQTKPKSSSNIKIKSIFDVLNSISLTLSENNSRMRGFSLYSHISNVSYMSLATSEKFS